MATSSVDWYQLSKSAEDLTVQDKEPVISNVITFVEDVRLKKEKKQQQPHSLNQIQQQHAARRSAPLPIRDHVPADVPEFTGHQVLHYLQMDVMGNKGQRSVDQLPVMTKTDPQIMDISRNL
jgi:hypothetical protein